MWTSRNRIADLASLAGCDVRSGLTRATTILVVGSDNVGPSKLRKAKNLIASGQSLRVMTDAEFRRIL